MSYDPYEQTDPLPRLGPAKPKTPALPASTAVPIPEQPGAVALGLWYAKRFRQALQAEMANVPPVAGGPGKIRWKRYKPSQVSDEELLDQLRGRVSLAYRGTPFYTVLEDVAQRLEDYSNCLADIRELMATPAEFPASRLLDIRAVLARVVEGRAVGLMTKWAEGTWRQKKKDDLQYHRAE